MEKIESTLKGIVIHGFSFGKSFDDILITNVVLQKGAQQVKEGLYFVLVDLLDFSESKNALMYVPKESVFHNKNTVELHILDFREPIVDCEVSIRVQKKKRNTQHFDSIDHLLKQMRQDIIWARKYFLRDVLRKTWESINDFDRFDMGKRAIAFFESNEYFLSAKRVFVYAPRRDEINFVQKLCSKFKEKNYYFPRIENDDMCFYPALFEDLKPGKFGILEPPKKEKHIVPSQKNDVLIIPAVAIDYQKNRIGKGAGYYDRFLQKHDVHTIAVIPDFAYVKTIPSEPHDKPVDTVFVVPVRS